MYRYTNHNAWILFFIYIFSPAAAQKFVADGIKGIEGKDFYLLTVAVVCFLNQKMIVCHVPNILKKMLSVFVIVSQYKCINICVFQKIILRNLAVSSQLYLWPLLFRFEKAHRETEPPPADRPQVRTACGAKINTNVPSYVVIFSFNLTLNIEDCFHTLYSFYNP